MVKYQVLFHLDEGSSFRGKLTMSNIKNLRDDLGDEVEIKLVVNSAGVKLFLHESSPIKDEALALMQQGVTMAICQNSMKYYDLDKAAFLQGVVFVASGVVELARKQAEGWSYIRP
jgi:intracellular sulfur oxidation DsrE/DsrF family protein